MALPENPITRKETYLAKIAGQEVQIPDVPITREEAYLDEIAKNGGGGGGTSNYNELTNRPQINGNTLAGDKSAEDLGLAGAGDIPTKVSDLDNDANFISDDNYVHTDNNYDDNAKGIVDGVTEALAGKQDTLTFDNVPTEDSNNPVKSGGVYASDEAIRKWTTAEAKSVSGNPITLLDGSARKAEGLSVECNPKQNLHGYDHPWAGGAGKNKLDVSDCIGTQDGKTFALSDNLGITVSGSASGTVFRPANTNVVLTPSTNYVVNGMSADIKLRFQIYDSNNTMTRELYATNVDLSFTTTADEVKAVVYIVVANNANGTVYPMIRLSTVSDASFEPYTNECPITGYTECVVDRAGKNLFVNSDTTYSNSAISRFVFANKPLVTETAGRYYISFDFKITEVPQGSNGEILFYASDNGTQAPYSIAKFTKTSISTDWEHIELLMSRSETMDAITCLSNNRVTIKNVMVSELGGDFEPYSHANVTLTFGETVYGGSVDFKTGKVTVTHASIASYNGETINEPWLSSMDEYVSGTTPTTGAQVVYPLTTPTELTLTPAELELLKGYNYISTNGTTIALDYLPDSLLAEAENYVDAKIPPAPTTDGTYVLTCTVTSGTPAYSWESAT